jgi:hypothetical protein
MAFLVNINAISLKQLMVFLRYFVLRNLQTNTFFVHYFEVKQPSNIAHWFCFPHYWRKARLYEGERCQPSNIKCNAECYPIYDFLNQNM